MDKGNLRGRATITLKGRATLSAEQARTGRRIRADSLHARVQAWANSPVSDRGEEAAFAESLLRVTRLEIRDLTCFRGRRFASGYLPRSEEMGPPPERVVEGGRYNRKGEPVLYLSETEHGVTREPILDAGPLWLQRFRLPTDVLSIADMRLDKVDEFLNQVLWFAEQAGDSHIQTSFSQRIAALVSDRFDGFIAPGVRGDGSYKYNNVVVIKRISEWMSWIDSGSGPTIVKVAAA